MTSDYEWDVFISYHRSSGHSGAWVNEHFKPLLEGALADRLTDTPRVYLDTAMPTGVMWPAHLKRALARSRLLVSVWSAPYTQSNWCWLELMTMKAREEALGLCTEQNPMALVHVVQFCDGEVFPPDIVGRYAAADFRQFAHTTAAFRLSQKYIEFEEKVADLANEIVANIHSSPQFDATFPALDECELPTVPASRFPLL